VDSEAECKFNTGTDAIGVKRTMIIRRVLNVIKEAEQEKKDDAHRKAMSSARRPVRVW